jgi:hypothetical protein
MTDYTNYGNLLYTSTTSGSAGTFTLVAGVVKLEPGAVKVATVDARNHGSGKYPSKISGCVVEIDDFKATLSYSGSSLDSMYTDMINGTAEHFKLAFTNGKNWYFDALLSEWAAESADAQSPELLQVSISMEPTGTMIIA